MTYGLLGDGSSIGLQLSYKVQPSPDNSANVYLGESFVGNDDVSLILGDNVFMELGYEDSQKV